MFTLLAFYKYVSVPDPASVCSAIYAYFLMLGITGKLYLSPEGINGNFTGTPEQVDSAKLFLCSFPGFTDLFFKDETTTERAYKKLAVRVKKELVHSGLTITPGEGALRLTPDDLNALYEKGEPFIIIDTRNSYESEIGYFKGALRPEMTTFRDWPQVVEELKPYRESTVVTYCTGGIRCEKAAAYMAQQGFKKVYQLDGGILTYIHQHQNKYWQGGMFVFDDRKVVEPNTDADLKYTSLCKHCSQPTAHYINCYNLDCDRIFVCCQSCAESHNYRCSDPCKQATRVRTDERNEAHA